MTDPSLFRAVLAVTEPDAITHWLSLARAIAPEDAEVDVRALVTVPAGHSLSEATLTVRKWRETFAALVEQGALVGGSANVITDHAPAVALQSEVRTVGARLLIAQWAGPDPISSHPITSEIMSGLPCDVVLIARFEPQCVAQRKPVMLPLRGGPNLSLGVRVARALAHGNGITLVNIAETHNRVPSLVPILLREPQITRSVTEFGSAAGVIVREAQSHKAIVMGAGMSPAANPSVVNEVFDRTTVPFALVRAGTPETLDFHAPLDDRPARETLSTRVDRWFAQNTYHSTEFSDLRALMALKEKQGVTISLGLPTLNEAATLGSVIAALKPVLMDETRLVDEIVVIDSGSSDETTAIACAHGVPVVQHADVLPEVGTQRGKGEALWKSLHVLKGDLIAWVDTDISNMHPRFVYGLLGPLLKSPQVQYVKGYYQRPIEMGGRLQAFGGGRVTELVARPLFNLFYPELSGMIQPLSGEYAGRRSALERVPFFSGYGVEAGLLIDLHERFGLESLAQTDLEIRIHRNQSLVSLSRMSFAIMQIFIARLEGRYGASLLDMANRSMKTVVQDDARLALEIADISDHERAPMIEVPQYRRSRGLA